MQDLTLPRNTGVNSTPTSQEELQHRQGCELTLSEVEPSSSPNFSSSDDLLSVNFDPHVQWTKEEGSGFQVSQHSEDIRKLLNSFR
ncbi:hypothetical protein BaRGS_00007995 [Batillaria attramentaria]|uniref:Uncharacterized protein n=1 Tax=Batillaria attramentaria TaxID=370345 RepID=A0ABD0LND6_9CAEN